MASGNFDPNVAKIRPGTYVNFKKDVKKSVGESERGTVLLPLSGHTYGPAATFTTITNDNPDGAKAVLGYSVYDTNDFMLLIREAFKHALKVIVYTVTEGVKASVTAGGLTATAKYGGTRGNSFKMSVTANASSGFDVAVYLGTELVTLHEGLSTAAQAIAKGSDYVTFSGSGNLSAASAASFTGGTDVEPSNTDITTFLTSSEGVNFDTMAFPLTDSDLLTAVKTKIKEFRDEAGKNVQAVVANSAADYEGIINVTNAVKLTDGTTLTAAQCTAYVAGLTASATKSQSNTNVKYDGAASIVGAKSRTAAETAIGNGELFFSYNEDSEIVVEVDINSLKTFTAEKDKAFSKNRFIRVIDSFSRRLKTEFAPNKFDNNSDGWDIMEGVGRSILQEFENENAITDVDLKNDFVVDRTLSTGDSVYVTFGLKAKDSAEKLYFSGYTR